MTREGLEAALDEARALFLLEPTIKVLQSKNKHKGLGHACSLILLQQTTMLAASSIGFFHQLCGFSILLRLIQHSIIILQLYLQNS